VDANIPLWTGGGTDQQIDLGQKASVICVVQEQFDSKSIVVFIVNPENKLMLMLNYLACVGEIPMRVSVVSRHSSWAMKSRLAQQPYGYPHWHRWRTNARLEGNRIFAPDGFQGRRGRDLSRISYLRCPFGHSLPPVGKNRERQIMILVKERQRERTDDEFYLRAHLRIGERFWSAVRSF